MNEDICSCKDFNINVHSIFIGNSLKTETTPNVHQPDTLVNYGRTI